MRRIVRRDGVMVVDRELEGGIIAETEVSLPALLTIQTGINEPRYASFRQIKQADQREIDIRDAGEVTAGLRSRGVRLPESGAGAEMLEGDAAQTARRIVDIIRERLP